MKIAYAQFAVGQIFHHRKFDYCSVIVDVDTTFQGSAQWHKQITRRGPRKEKPWYHVLVHQCSIETYVAERHLVLDDEQTLIDHPYVAFFRDLVTSVYVSHHSVN